jgi:hypothetical protein
MIQDADEKHSDQESEQHFQKLVTIALKSPPKPQKMMTRKGVPAQSKKRTKSKRRVA